MTDPADTSPPSGDPRLVEDIQALSANMDLFNRDAHAHADCALKLARQTIYWIFDSDTGLFGPSNFVGFEGMDFANYQGLLEQQHDGPDLRVFSGGKTRVRISKVCPGDPEKAEGRLGHSSMLFESLECAGSPRQGRAYGRPTAQ